MDSCKKEERGMIISLGADHGGYELKDKLAQYLVEKGYEIIDNGTDSPDSVDYPSFGAIVAKDILEKRAELGVIVCGSGIGISISANRFKGIRAAIVTGTEYAQLARQHNNANIIALGGRFTTFEDAKKYLDIFLSTSFEGGRHEKRINRIDELN